MPLFDLGNDVRVTQHLSTPPAQAYAFSKQILESYKSQGYTVRFPTDRPPSELVGEFKDKDGTSIRALVTVTASGPGSSVKIQLTGKVYVGGFKGRLATDSAVQNAARDMLKDEIKKTLKANGLAAALQAISQREQLYAYAVQRRGGARYA